MEAHQTAIKYLERAVEASKQYMGESSLHTAGAEHALAVAYSYVDDFNSALQHEKVNAALLEKVRRAMCAAAVHIS